MRLLEHLTRRWRMIWTIGALLSVGSAHGATFIVTTSADAGAGSLRAAVAAASNGDTVEFAAALSGQTIALTGGLLLIDKDLTLDASMLDTPVAVSGSHASRVLEIRAGAALVMDGLIIEEGAADIGGGILSRGGLVLRNCTLRSNQAVLFGGAIANISGVLIMTGCTVTGNSSEDGEGGGVWSDTSFELGPSRMINCTVVNNTAGTIGGGVYNFDGELEVIHCTIVGNVAAPGQGSGIASFGDVQTQTLVGDSIVVGNSDNDVDFVELELNTFISDGHNLIGGGNGVGSFNQRSDTTGVDDPRLAPLADFGGRTHTRPPLPGSPVIEAGKLDTNTPATDQRGAPRVSGRFPDIGAVEAFAFSQLPLVDTDGDGIDDRLEPAYGFVVGIDESGVDSDGDGQTDAVEISNMTDPHDPDSRFEILSFAPASGGSEADGPLYEIEFTSFPGLNYRVEISAEATFADPLPQPSLEATGFDLQTTVNPDTPNAFFRVRRE